MSTTEKILVSSHGYSDAEIFFLGGHPLNDDLREGIALTGSVEKTLDSYLRQHRLSTKNCYRSVFIKEKLAYSGTNSKRQREALEKIDYKGYEEQLLAELKEVNPTVIVPLDDLALGAVFPQIRTNKKPARRKFWIYCYRGSILPLRADWQLLFDSPLKIIPIIGPQLQYADWTVRSYTQLDFTRIVQERLSRNEIKEFGNLWVCRSILEFDRFLDRMRAIQPKRVTFDLEWSGGLMTAISLCFDGIESVSIPFSDKDMSAADKAFIYQRLAKILNSEIEKNNQNIKEDWKILERHGFNVCNVRSDSMLKGSLLYPELPKGLDFYTSIYTPIPYYKDEGQDYDIKRHGKDGFYIYNAKDSLSAHIASVEMDKELEAAPRLKKLYDEELAPSILIYKNIDNRGLLVDTQVKDKLLEKYNKLYDSNEWILKNMIGKENFNAKSPQQVGSLIYEDLKFPIRKKILENGAVSYKTDKNTLDELLILFGEHHGKIGYNILSRIIMLRKLSKVIEYINTPLYPDNTFRGTYNLAGTETGRSSCSKTLDVRFRNESDSKSTKQTKRLGRSLQTISKHGFAVDEDVFDDFNDNEIADDIRLMFVPRRGFVFVEGDGSGAEARAVFVLANDYEGLAAMDQKPKIHAKTAAAIFGIDVNTITSNFPKVPKIGIAYYDLGKRMRHAGNYQMGAFRLAQMTHLPFKFCEDALEKFHAHNPNIREVFHKDVIAFLKKFHYLETPIGRKRDFFSQYSDDQVKEAIAYIPQSCISDQTKFTMWRIVDQLEGYMKKYFFNVEAHDGILAEVRVDILEQYLETFKRIYERPISFRECSLPRDFDLVIPAELSVGFCNWQNMVEIKL